MDLSAVDRSSTQGRSWLHAATPVAKLMGLALVLTAVVASWNVLVLGAVLALLAAGAVSAGVPLRLAAGLASYPAIFAALFAFASAPDTGTAIVIVLKAVTAAAAAVLVVLTTPYPQLFAPLQRVTPAVVGDALLMTYRTAFLLLGSFDDTLRAVRLRAGLRAGHPLRSARAIVLSLGSVLLYGIDLAQRDYDVMRLRGYGRRLQVGPPRFRSLPASAWVVLTGAACAAVSVLWRLDWQALNPWSWIPLVPALGALAAALVLRPRRRT